MTPEIEICCVCRVEQIEIETDGEFVLAASDEGYGSMRETVTIKTPGAVDGREFGYSEGRYVGPICAEAIAA